MPEGNGKDKLPKGVLYQRAGEGKYELTRYAPSGATGRFIQHYWQVHWDLREQAPFTQTVLAYPNINLVFEQAGSYIHGIAPATSSHELEGKGWVVGIKFRPGGFYPFWKRPVSELTGRAIEVQEVFGSSSKELEREIFLVEDADRAVQLVEDYLKERLPEPDPRVDEVSRICEAIQNDRTILKVDDAVLRCGLHKRSLQRLFDRYVGVSPKSVIQRYRLHEAAERIDGGTGTDWLELSLELGYYDHSHFIRDFKLVLGLTPDEYARSKKNA